ncbi:hypothetical protein F9B85_10850 [Heliorestis acidaminivorans]|uniref:Uncharacterized protein n=1 Tax=Heliorestis acidaminivorans TaxID=553427 RepID=A0A6I0EYG8_9FIRM|nr:hypothetical protein [Heliorestis acidaminivorans]KAB2951783.1 hypothetical protein F9B85_10850 [Heliorestis acidaminivorans]
MKPLVATVLLSSLLFSGSTELTTTLDMNKLKAKSDCAKEQGAGRQKRAVVWENKTINYSREEGFVDLRLGRL